MLPLSGQVQNKRVGQDRQDRQDLGATRPCHRSAEFILLSVCISHNWRIEFPAPPPSSRRSRKSGAGVPTFSPSRLILQCASERLLNRTARACASLSPRGRGPG